MYVSVRLVEKLLYLRLVKQWNNRTKRIMPSVYINKVIGLRGAELEGV